tara:strand:- start:1283 stop:1654 length:372 start_codon:yes stop_codon:yes gene_type:complete
MFRHRSNGRNFRRRSNDNDKIRLASSSFQNGRSKNNFKSYQSVEKLLERYKVLAKEALSTGDKILSENYLQHVDHFSRIISERNVNQNQNGVQTSTTNKDEKPNDNLANNTENNESQIVKDKK